MALSNGDGSTVVVVAGVAEAEGGMESPPSLILCGTPDKRWSNCASLLHDCHVLSTVVVAGAQSENGEFS